jgi:hypothetical protein
MDELIKQQEEVVAALQQRLVERLGKRSPIDTVSQCLSRAVEDLSTLKALSGSKDAEAHSG